MLEFLPFKTNPSTIDATKIWRMLSGICVLYKPPGMGIRHLREVFLESLCKDLNNMNVRPPMKHVVIEGKITEPMKVKVQENLADHVLVVGPRYQPRDFKFMTANLLRREQSGVLICGLNGSVRDIHGIRDSKATKIYKLKGILGRATDTYHITGKVMERSTWKHVKRVAIDRLCASMQSSHQRKMFELCGVDMQSQAAYELAVQGLVRPADDNLPMIYAIKCVDFNAPEFTLEVVCINEYEMYLKTLVHELGMALHSTATCTQIQCVQYGLFNLEHALLRKHWDVENVLYNMQDCRQIIEKNRHLLCQTSPVLVEGNG